MPPIKKMALNSPGLLKTPQIMIRNYFKTTCHGLLHLFAGLSADIAALRHTYYNKMMKQLTLLLFCVLIFSLPKLKPLTR